MIYRPYSANQQMDEQTNVTLKTVRELKRFQLIGRWSFLLYLLSTQQLRHTRNNSCDHWCVRWIYLKVNNDIFLLHCSYPPVDKQTIMIITESLIYDC